MLYFVVLIVEEKGLLGVSYYVVYLLVLLDKIVVVLNIEMFSLDGLICDIVLWGKGWVLLECDLECVVKVRGCSYSLDLNLEVGFFYCVDYFVFVCLGVLVIIIGLGLDKLDGGVEVGCVLCEKYFVDCYY